MANTPTVYVICDANCKFEGMTKEQIYAAILQAVNEGTIGDIDSGFVQTIKTINGIGLKFFLGTQAEYEALTDEEKENLFAIITNDTTKEGIIKAITDLQNELNEIKVKISNNDLKAKIAEKIEIKNVSSTDDIDYLSQRCPNSYFVLNVTDNIDFYFESIGYDDGHDIDYTFTVPRGALGLLWTKENTAYYALFVHGTNNIYTIEYAGGGWDFTNFKFEDWAAEKAKKFNAPELSTSSKLPSKGYYNITYLMDDEYYSTGVFYWDGVTELFLPTIMSRSINTSLYMQQYVPVIKSGGSFVLETADGGGEYPAKEIYISKVW